MLPLVPFMKERVLALKKQQDNNRRLGLQFQALFRRCHAFRARHWRAKISSFFSPVSLYEPAKPYGSRACGLEISGIFAGAVLATVKNNLITHQKYDENVEKVLNLLAQIEHFLRKLAERVGFEPTVPLPVHLISRYFVNFGNSHFSRNIAEVSIPWKPPNIKGFRLLWP